MEKLLRINDVAEALGKHPQTVRILMRNGDLPGKKIGRHWYVLESEFLDFMRSGSAEDSDS